jgi:hypothetical protein
MAEHVRIAVAQLKIPSRKAEAWTPQRRFWGQHGSRQSFIIALVKFMANTIRVVEALELSTKE